MPSIHDVGKEKPSDAIVRSSETRRGRRRGEGLGGEVAALPGARLQVVPGIRRRRPGRQITTELVAGSRRAGVPGKLLPIGLNAIR